MVDIELIMPKMGESITEATIIKWLKTIGDPIKADEAVLEIATDKVDSEIPSPVTGTISTIFFEEGDIVEVGKPLAIISGVSVSEAKDLPRVEIKDTSNLTENISEDSNPDLVVESDESKVDNSHSNKKNRDVLSTIYGDDKEKEIINERFYSPLVLSMAKKEGIDMQELSKIPGTGRNQRVTKHDMINYFKSKPQSSSSKSFTEKPIIEEKIPGPEIKQEDEAFGKEDDKIVEMDRVRKLTARHMVMSKQTSAHVTSIVEADVTELVNWREQIKQQFEERENEKLTYTPLFIEVIVKAIKDFPIVNSSVDGEHIIYKKDINIGMATALPSGNLIVPVIKQADRKSLTGISKEVNDLASRARESKLLPEEIEGGTFTLTNIGTFDNLIGTPIILQPQVSILAVGAIKKKPVVVETPQGDMIAIRHMMYLSFSYDHRIIDGAVGGAFVKRVGEYLEQFEVNRNY